MYKEIRRKDRAITDIEEIQKILKKVNYGVLGTVSEDGQPYAVPLSYAYENNNFYFHCATVGHKLENISYNNKASFTVVGDVKTLAEKFSTEYESVIAFGKVVEIFDEEKNFALFELIKKYSPNFLEEGKQYIERSGKATRVYKFVVEHLTGKARK